MKRSGIFALVGIAAVVVLLLGAATTAYAWDLSKSTNGVVLVREATDVSTQTVTVTLYYDYKGGSSWGTTYTPTSTGSYDKYDTVASTAALWEAWEIPLKEDYRCQMVRLTQTGQDARAFVVLNEPMDVIVRNDSVAIPVTIASTPTVSLSASSATLPVSIAGTDPVSIVGTVAVDSSVTIDSTQTVQISDLPDGSLGAIVSCVAVACGVVVARALWRSRAD